MSRMLVCGCVAVLFLAPVVRADDAEDAAAKWVEGVGGKVTRDATANGKPVVEVFFGSNKKVTNDGLKELQGLKNLKSLTVFFCEQITDDGMKHVKGLTTLEKLSITNTGVGDDGVAALKDLKNLTALKKLKLLYIGGASLTDAAVKDIADNMPDLEGLEIGARGLAVTDDSVPHFAKLKKLKALGIRGSKLTDTGLKELQKALPNCKITK